MDYREIIHNKFCEPAAVYLYKDGEIKALDINEKFLPELKMNVAVRDYLEAPLDKCFDADSLRIFVEAIGRCADFGKDQSVETIRLMFSDCCGYDHVYVTDKLMLIDKTADGAIIFDGIRNITNEKQVTDALNDIEYRYVQTSEQVNIYNWEYYVDTKEMRPCYRCMRDLGLPAVVENYPEPAFEAGIFPMDYYDLYTGLLRDIDNGLPEAEVDIPLTVGRIPFRIKYTTQFDEKGRPVKAFGSATLISETELGNIKLDNQIIQSLAEEYSSIALIDFPGNEGKIIKADGFLGAKENVDITDILSAAAGKADVSDEEKAALANINLLRNELFKDTDKREFLYKDDAGNKWIRIDYHVIERSADNRVDRLIITASVIDDVRAQKMDADRLIASQKQELENRQTLLLSAIDEANRANKAKIDFFSSMSHDIRTPMSAITGFSRLAMDEIDNREHLEDYLDKITKAGDHLMNLINDILDMSRIESGKMELSESPSKIKDLLNECASMVRVKMNENGLDFKVDVDEAGDDTVECDCLRFNQVILNLLSNAYKFTPRGGSVFLTGKLKEKSDRLHYEIRVKDTGIGMSEEFSKHIWEAYSRENRNIVNETQGTGLGMMIVQNIVNIMQGTIELETELGKGSEFIINIPLKQVTINDADVLIDKDTEAALSRDYSGTTVLVVDDIATNLKLAQRVLEKHGFTVITADNGLDAIETVKNSKPGDIDLVLMDVLMPVMDGLEATRKIRALDDPALSSIPIVAMTANAFESDIRDTLEAGMNAHVSKPFVQEKLILSISENLKGR